MYVSGMRLEELSANSFSSVFFRGVILKIFCVELYMLVLMELQYCNDFLCVIIWEYFRTYYVVIKISFMLTGRYI